MPAITRKYNPSFLSIDELVATFCVRIAEFESLIETLRACSDNANTHQIVIGPRGSGKTSLLLRVAAEVFRDVDFSTRFFPIVFAEESYEVSTAGEFWLECLSRLVDQAPRREGSVDLHRSFEELRNIYDDQTLEDRCLGQLQDFADGEGKRLVLIVENLNMMFRDIGDDNAGWRLRKVLQTEPRIVLLASTTSRFEEMNDPNEALYELFRVTRLRPLDTDDCATLWRTVSGQQRAPQTIQALRILTGGSPRLLTIVARFGANLSFHELMDDLLDLVDDHTEYFKSHLDALPAQERKVYLALADLWKPANTREIAERARLGTSKCSAQLARLIDRGAVEVSGGSARRKLYYLTERLYNIYYLMRRARGPVPLISALIRFMEAYYLTDELREFGIRMARDARSSDGSARTLYRMVFERLVGLPSLAAHREDLLSIAPPTFTHSTEEVSALSPVSSVSKALFEKALSLAEKGELQDAVAAWDEVVLQFGESRTPADLERVSLALVNKGKTLGQLGRRQEALAIWDDVVRRFGGNHEEGQSLAVATSLVSKGKLLSDLNRHKESLTDCEEVVRRYGGSLIPEFKALVASAQIGMVVALSTLNRPQEALMVCDEVLERFGENGSSMFLSQLASAMVGRGHALIALNRSNEAIIAWGAVVERFRKSDSPRIVEQVASALANIGAALVGSGQLEKALNVFDGVVQNHAGSDVPLLREVVAHCLANRGNVLAALKRETEAISSWEEAIRRFEKGDLPEAAEPHSVTLMNMAATLLHSGRQDEAIKFWGKVVERFEVTDHPGVLTTVANAQTNRGALLEQLGRYEEALTVWQQVEDRFAGSDAPEWQALVASSFVHKCANLFELNRPEEALATCDRAIVHMGQSGDLTVLDEVAGILLNKGIVLVTLHRYEEALTVWEEFDRRFGHSDGPAISKFVASALVSKGTTLAKLDRSEEAIGVWNDMVRRFEAGDSPAFHEEIATAILNKVLVLGNLNRSDEALETCEEALRRFGNSDEPYALEAVAQVLFNKGALFFGMGQTEEALAVWGEVARRFESSNQPALRNAAVSALCGLAEYELTDGQARTAIAFLDRVLLPERESHLESRLKGHLVRARAHVVEGDLEASTTDVKTALSILPELNVLPREVLEALANLATDVGPESMCDLIKSSPSDTLLLPLRTALERELGLEPRVAKEVKEIAEDIRRDLLVQQKNEGPRQTA